MHAENELVVTLRAALGSQRKALTVIGLSRGTWHYRHNPRPPVAKPIPQSERAYPSRISDVDRAQIGTQIRSAWVRGHSVDHAFAQAWDAGVMLASRRSWWRIAVDLEQQDRPHVPPRSGTRAPRPTPIVTATAPHQAWSWDITELHTPWRGITLKAYKITDIFSRQIVGWRVEDREVDALAVEMFREAINMHGAPQVVHADSGSAMRSSVLRDALGDYDVTLSHNRPYVSNDNPFSEAGFRTMKYRPGYPGVFTDLDHARDYLQHYVDWYNTEHRHSGIALFTPQQVATGTWQHIWQTRDRAQQAYYHKHPERFRARPRTPQPSPLVGINLPKQEQPQAA